MSDSQVSKNKFDKRIGIVWLTIFIDLVGFSIIFPLFPAMLEWYLPREGSDSLLGGLVNFLRGLTPDGNNTFLVSVLFGGFLGSLYSLLQFISAPFWGRLSDRYGRRSILLITTSGTAIGYLLWCFSGSFILLICSRLLGGLMAGNISVATAAISDLTTKKNRSKGMALVGVAFGMGFILGPAIGGLSYLVNLSASDPGFWGLTPFSFPALIAFAMAMANVLWIKAAFPETNKQRIDRLKLKGLFGFGTKISDANAAIRTYFIFLFAFAGMEFTLTFLALERLAYSPSQMPLIFLFVGFVLIITQGYVVRRYAQKLGEQNLATAGLLLCILGLCTLSFAHNSQLFYIGLLLIGSGSGCVTPSLSSLVSLYCPEDAQGAALGSFRSAGALARALGPGIAAIIFWKFGSDVAYLSGAVILVISVLFSLTLPKPRIQ